MRTSTLTLRLAAVTARMTRLPWSLLLLALFSNITMGAEAGSLLEPADPVFEQIIRLERERMQAYKQRDVEYLAHSFAPEYLHTNLRGGTTTREEEIAFYADEGFSLGEGQVGDFVVRRYDEVVVATGEVAWIDAQYRGVDLSGRFRVTRVYVLREGRWLLATSHASRIGG